MGHEFVAVIERRLFNRDANVGHYITSDLSRWLNNEAAALQSDLYTEASLYMVTCTRIPLSLSKVRIFAHFLKQRKTGEIWNI